MALVLNDRVKETTTTTGTGTINLGGAATGFETFVAGIGNSNTTYYCIAGQGTTEFEVGIGTVTDASPDTLSRTTILSSSNSDSAVNFSAGTKDVFCTLPASKTIREVDTALNVPTGTTAQRAGSPAAGDLRFNTTTSKFEGYSGSAWGDIGVGNFLVTNTFTGDGSDTTFTISNAVADENNLLVFIDGVFQAQNVYSISGTTLTFATAPANGRVITVYSALNNIQGANVVKATMTGDNSDTTLALGVTPISENAVQVFFDGVYQNKDSFSISGETLTFGVAPPTGVAVEAITLTVTDLAAAASSILVDEFTGDGSDTTFTLSAAPANENNTQVFVGGVYQEKATYSISGTTLTFSEAPANTVSIEVVSVAVGQINSAIQLSDADGDTKVMVEESADEDKIRFDTGGTERAIIDSTGLGIGTSSPASKLHISATGETRLILEGDSDNDSGEESSLIEFRTDGGAVRHRVEATGSSGNDLKITAGADQTTNTLNSEIIFETKTANSSTAERMRIDADGNVGIGVSSIVREPLQVHRASSSDVQIHMTNTSTGTSSTDGMTIFANSTTSGFWYREAGNMLFATSSTERMRISSLGEVAIGSTSIFTDGSDNSGSGTLHIANNNGRVLYLKRAGSNGEIVSFYRGGISSEVGNISISTSTTAYNTSSDYRLKENVNYEFNALDRLKQLKPARFNFIIEKDETVDGFLAHEVSSIVPEAITGEKDAVDKEGNPIYQGIDQSKLVPLLTKAIQELTLKVEELESKIE